MLLKSFSTELCNFLLCAAIIPVQFNPANYSVKEGVNGSAVIFLEALDDHDTDFTVIVNSRDETAIGELCLQYSNNYTITLHIATALYTSYCTMEYQ